jgi:hypothetical protein
MFKELAPGSYSIGFKVIKKHIPKMAQEAVAPSESESTIC